MYENRVGVVAVGTVTEYWDRDAHRPSIYYQRGDDGFDHEYRIAMAWCLDLSGGCPICIDELRERIGYTPVGQSPASRPTNWRWSDSSKSEVERDLSVPQQLLDVVVVRQGRRQFVGTLPDGLEGLRPYNLLTFKSHHESLDGWAMKELVGADVAYRKFVSPSPSRLLPEELFGLYAVCARFPHKLSGQVPWQQVQSGVYDCRWGIDTIRVIVAGELPREPHNAPFHLFSASPELVAFGGGAYQWRSENTSALLQQLFTRFQEEGFAVSFTMEDFQRQYAKKYFARLTPKEQREALELLPPEEREQVLEALPPEERMAGLSPEQIRQYLDRLTAKGTAAPRKPRRKK